MCTSSPRPRPRSRRGTWPARAVQGRYAAQAQIERVASLFWHDGESGAGEEWRIRLVTSPARRSALVALLAQEHPWRNPEIAEVDVTVSPENLGWLTRVTDA
ncbi:divalent cation tolerance protein CutA [Pilimelia anulata]|uniref:divalent cation tolerance protein CutA n=1 Tax=Pilimelia anulata TaxID=53371 RepID=UPI003570BF92